MDVLIVYDSYFGNTEKVAKAVGDVFGPDATLTRVGDVQPSQLKGVKLLIVGSPTRAFRPSEGTQKFLKSLSPGDLQGVKVAAFDTRISAEDSNSGFLKFMIKLFGYAAKPIADKLKKNGGSLAAEPEGFYVKESEGPLKEGELERAVNWAKAIH